MPEIKIECPETGEIIGIGISMPAEIIDDNMIAANETDCPHCGRLHAWDKVQIVEPLR